MIFGIYCVYSIYGNSSIYSADSAFCVIGIFGIYNISLKLFVSLLDILIKSNNVMKSVIIIIIKELVL